LEAAAEAFDKKMVAVKNFLACSSSALDPIGFVRSVSPFHLLPAKLDKKLQNAVMPSCRHAPAPSPQRPPSAGVTLMEMLVVVMIIALLAGISVPAVSAGIDSVRLRSATDSISAFLNAAEVRAERRQQPVELIVSPKENAFALYSNEPGFARELKLPDGISIEAVLPPESDEEGPRRLILLPGGGIPAIGVQVANRHGSRRIVHLDPMTGYPRVDVVAAQ
jgi:general secretion pathway protein H